MLEPYKIKIDQAIARLSFSEQPADLYDPIRYLLSLGGKRIRPILALMAAELYGADKVDDAMPAALAIELFHNFTLVHDDIMDRAPLRRGQPTIYQKWNDAVAILVGDKLMVRAYSELSQSPSYALPELLNTFNQVAREVCEGQQWDMQYEKEAMVSEAEYIEMIRLKTAVLLGASLKMGAIVGGASPNDAQCLYDFGVSVGIAFQLQDDILDLYGESTHVGKQIGGDILANKKTILQITAYSRADESNRTRLLRYFEGNQALTPAQEEEKIQVVRAIYDEVGVLPQVSLLQEEYVEQAFSSLDKMEVDSGSLQTLRNLAQSLLKRTH